MSYFACAFFTSRRRSPLFCHPPTRRARLLSSSAPHRRRSIFNFVCCFVLYISRSSARFVGSRFSIVRRAPKLENSEMFALSVAKVRHRHKNRSELFVNIFREREELLHCRAAFAASSIDSGEPTRNRRMSGKASRAHCRSHIDVSGFFFLEKGTKNVPKNLQISAADSWKGEAGKK